LFVPTKTPPDIVKKIHSDTVAALTSPTVKAKLQQIGYVAVGSNPEELAKMLKGEIVKWAAVVKDAGLKVN